MALETVKYFYDYPSQSIGVNLFVVSLFTVSCCGPEFAAYSKSPSREVNRGKASYLRMQQNDQGIGLWVERRSCD